MKSIRVYLFIAVFIWINFSCDTVDKEANQNLDIQSQNEKHPVLLVSIDGMMNEYLERNDTPNFDQFLSDGVSAEYLIPIFPTKTFPNHWSIVTGLYTENHGIIANSFFDYDLDARFSYGPPDENVNGEDWWGGEPIWVTAEKQNKTAVTFFWPGSESSINGVRPTKWKDYDGSVPDSTRIDTIAAWFDPIGDVKADFGTLYFSFVDGTGHRYGPNSTEVDKAVVEMDNLLGYLFTKLNEIGLSDSISIVLTSDHGMAELSNDKIIFLDDIINMNHVDVIDWTPVAMLKPNSGRADAIYHALKQNEENYTVFWRDELPDRFRFRGHNRIPEIIMIADVSYTITNRTFYEQRGIVAGAHGFDNYAPEMRTFFAAKGPIFKQGEIVSPFESIHIYELLNYLLAIEPAPNDGDPELLKNLLLR